MRRRDLDKLRRLDPALARQLEGVLERKEAEPAAAVEASEAAPGAAEVPLGPTDTGRAVSTPLVAAEASLGATAPAKASHVPQGGPAESGAHAEAPNAAAAQGRCETASGADAGFVSADAQAGLPEVPQTLVSTETAPAARLAETWAGYADDCVPEDELERRKVERAAEREAQRARDREHSAQLGFFPGAWFRRRGTGKHVSCEQLELQLDGIERRVGRASVWDEGLAASRTMDNVEAQCFAVRDLGDRPASLPEALRGTLPASLTRTQLDVLRAVVTAYMGGALGLYEYQPILASDLGMSERALRYALNGGKGRPPGLVELGLLKRRQTWKRGAGDRPSDHHYLLLQAGPALADELLPLTCARRAERGHRLPRRSGYTRGAARRRAAQGRQRARCARRDLAERVLARRASEDASTREDPPRRKPREERVSKPQTPELNCPAQNADNPVPPPSGEGGLRFRRGRPPSPPQQNESLRDETWAPATPPLSRSSVSDKISSPNSPTRDRAQALDGTGETRRLEYWRRRRARGLPIPDDIDAELLRARFGELRKLIWG